MSREDTLRVLSTFAIIGLLTGTAVLAGSPGSCISAEIPAAMVLPDGSVHPPGRLVLCATNRLNPVSEVQKVTVGGIPQGLYVARTSRSEMRTATPYVMFYRNKNGELILIGFVRPPRNPTDRATSVRLTDPGHLDRLRALGLDERPPTTLVAESLPILDGEQDEVVESTLMIAAR